MGKQFTYSLDFDNNTADGVHEYGGPADEKVIEKKFTKHFADAYFEEQTDGGLIHVFRNEDACASGESPIGVIKPAE